MTINGIYQALVGTGLTVRGRIRPRPADHVPPFAREVDDFLMSAVVGVVGAGHGVRSAE